jgi:small conductance mechanosensitive channel
MENFTLDKKYFDLIILYGPKVLTAVIILFIGLWLIKKMTLAAEKGMERSGLDPDLRPFLISVVNVMMKVFLILGVANIVGIETTSFVAILASAAFAVGLALQGTLSNFAAGVMILIFKPYRVGDLVEVQNIVARVKEIQIFNTILITGHNKIIIVPNSNAINGIIGNFTAQKIIKTNISIPVKYGADFGLVKTTIEEVIKKIPQILTEPAPEIEIDNFEQDGFLINVGASIHPEDIETISNKLRQKLYVELTNSGVKLGTKKVK